MWRRSFRRFLVLAVSQTSTQRSLSSTLTPSPSPFLKAEPRPTCRTPSVSSTCTKCPGLGWRSASNRPFKKNISEFRKRTQATSNFLCVHCAVVTKVSDTDSAEQRGHVCVPGGGVSAGGSGGGGAARGAAISSPCRSETVSSREFSSSGSVPSQVSSIRLGCRLNQFQMKYKKNSVKFSEFQNRLNYLSFLTPCLWRPPQK